MATPVNMFFCSVALRISVSSGTNLVYQFELRMSQLTIEQAKKRLLV